METANIIGIVSSSVSLILAFIAIWISFKFFQLSTISSEKTHDAAKDISATVVKLEFLFNHFYTDNFSMTKDMVEGLQRQALSGQPTHNVTQEIENITAEKIELLKLETDKKIHNLLAVMPDFEAKYSESISDLRNLVLDTIAKTREVEEDAKDEALENIIISTINEMFNLNPNIHIIAAGSVVHYLMKHSNYEESKIIESIKSLSKQKKIFYVQNRSGPDIIKRFASDSPSNI